MVEPGGQKEPGIVTIQVPEAEKSRESPPPVKRYMCLGGPCVYGCLNRDEPVHWEFVPKNFGIDLDEEA